jgi:hypothetical protein
MFSKKLLSLVALLFVGSQVTFVSAACTPTVGADCTLAEESDCTPNTYNYVSNKLIKFTANNACKIENTPGYYKTSDGNFYSIASGGTVAALGTEGNISSVSDCVAGNLINGGSFCVEASVSTHAIPMDGDGKLYLAVDTAAGLLNGVNNGKIVVKSVPNGFEVVTLEGGKNYLVVDTGKLLGDKNNDIIVIDNTSAIVAGIDGIDYCVDKNWNVYERKTGLCKAVVADGDEDCTKYYNCSSGKACEESSENIKRGNDCIPTAGNSCPKGYYLVKGGEYVINSNVADGTLFYCDGKNNCVDKKTAETAPLGYLVNAGDSGDEPYIVCTSSTSCKLATIGGSCVESQTDGAATYGGLYDSGNKLCIFSGGEKYIDTTTPGIHIIGKNAELFGITAENTKFIALEVDSDNNILVVDPTDTSGYYITADDGTAALSAYSSSIGSLYECVNASTHLKCSSITGADIPNGFLVNAGNGGTGKAPYIECKGSSGCNPIAVTGTSCAATAESLAVTTGTLYKEGGEGNFKICIFDGVSKAVELGGSEGNYFISTASSLFGLAEKADHFMVINIDTVGNITVKKERVRYRYTDGDAIAIESRTTAGNKKEVGEICGSGSQATEYILDEWDSALKTALGNSNFYYVKE